MNPIRIVRTVVGWSQTRLATESGTSQPTIAAYETGSKSPTWRTVQSIAAAAGLACYPFVGQPMTREDRRSLALHAAIAKELARSPDRVVAIARNNLDTMRAANPNASALLNEWKQILRLPVVRIASHMVDPSEHGRDLRQVTPFAGVLDAATRAAVYRSFRGVA